MPATIFAHPPLVERLRVHRAAHPRQYLRETAKELGVSELEALHAAEDSTITPLRTDDLAGLLTAITTLGPVRTMTRNDSVVLERTGTFGVPSFFGAVGQLLGDIDLRIFPGEWRHAVAVRPSSGRCSLQWFDASGTSIHKVHVDPAPAWDALVATWALGGDPRPHALEAAAAPISVDAAPSDLVAFHAGWDAMTDTHEFHALLRRHGVTRRAALAAAGAPRAEQLPVETLGRLLEGARDEQLTIMSFVGNRGVIQIHSGVPGRVARTPGWLNILDAEMNLHVREADIAETWLVRKPTSSGVIASLECFDADGREVLLVFGKRPDNAPASVTAPFMALLERVARPPVCE